MSNYWDLYCVDHGESCGFHWNHGDEQLARIWEARAAWAALGLTGRPGGFELRFPCESGGDDLPAFAADHQDCDVRVRDECGRDLGRCPAEVACPTCKHQGYCKLEVGHAGSHANAALGVGQ